MRVFGVLQLLAIRMQYFAEMAKSIDGKKFWCYKITIRNANVCIT
jgi:hypothetical protein